MDWVKSITDILTMISEGIDPTTGEIINVEDLKNDPGFQIALKKVERTYDKNRSGSVYARFEAEYPKHAIIMTEGYFFAVHNKSALVMHNILGYKIVLDFYKRPTTGGPNYEKISRAFRENGASFILVSKGELIERFDGVDPFEKYGIDENACGAIVSQKLSEFDSSNKTDTPALPGKSAKAPLLYPRNLLNEILPGNTDYPEDIKKRITAVLGSTAIFPEPYRRDAEYVKAYYEDGLTLEAIGNTYGVTRERIRQILKRALNKMRRKAVLSYLKGETDSPSVSRSREKAGFSEEIRENKDMPAALPRISDESVSISELARRLSGETEKVCGMRLRYADISAWLISTGDLMKIEDGNAAVTVPTAQGEEHGIKRGRRTNSSGVEYVGVFLERDGQQYIIENLDRILSFLGLPGEE